MIQVGELIEADIIDWYYNEGEDRMKSNKR